MNLLRRTHPGAGMTTAVVLLCGIVSGAALAANNQKAQAAPTVQNPKAPTGPGVPTIPGVNKPAVTSPHSVTQVQAPSSVTSVAQPARPQIPGLAQATQEDALVLRPDTAYERQTAQSPLGAQPLLTKEDEAPVLAASKPFTGMNVGGLGLFMMALLGGAGFLAYRKKQDQLVHGGDLTLEVASTIRVGAKWHVSLVRVPGRMLVVGSTERGLELLTELYPEGDEEAMEDLLTAVSAQPTQTAPVSRPVHSQPSQVREDAPADVFDPLADISPRYDDTRLAGTYNRPPRRSVDTTPRAQAAPSPQSSPAPGQGHDDAFLDAVLDRLSKARPAVIRHTTKPAPRVDERAALRAQVKQYRRGPTRL